MDPQYSNRELDMKFDTIIEKLDDIHEQTTKHNGRMSKIELWMNFVKGGLAVVGPIAFFLLYQYLQK